MRPKYRYFVRLARLANGERFALLYDTYTSLPVPETTRFSAIFRRVRNGSVSTMTAELRAISIALHWAQRRGIDLEERLGTVSLLLPEEIISLRDALREKVHGQASDLVTATTYYSRVKYVTG